jgi:hypothetical protein
MWQTSKLLLNPNMQNPQAVDANTSDSLFILIKAAFFSALVE